MVSIIGYISCTRKTYSAPALVGLTSKWPFVDLVVYTTCGLKR